MLRYICLVIGLDTLLGFQQSFALSTWIYTARLRRLAQLCRSSLSTSRGCAFSSAHVVRNIQLGKGSGQKFTCGVLLCPDAVLLSFEGRHADTVEMFSVNIVSRCTHMINAHVVIHVVQVLDALFVYLYIYTYISVMYVCSSCRIFLPDVFGSYATCDLSEKSVHSYESYQTQPRIELFCRKKKSKTHTVSRTTT